MRSQAQYTIYALNDIETSATAPSNPYTGQVWEDTSTSPPTMKVWNGSAWKEQNGTDTIKTNVTNLTTKANTLETNLNGLTSEVSSVTTRVTTVEDGLGNVEETVETLSSDVSTLQQTTTEISATVSKKVDETCGTSSSSFGWSLKSTGFYIYSNKSTVVKITSSGLEVSGKITSTSGQIGGFTIASTKLYKDKTAYSDTTAGVYLGTDGIGLGAGCFYVTSAGYLYCTSASIGGFTIDTNSIHNGTWGNNGSVMLCTGSEGSKSIGGSEFINGWTITSGPNFGVTSDGILYAVAANITGAINATSGYFEFCDIADSCNIYGYLYMSGAEEVKFYGSKCTMTYESWTGGTGTATIINQTPKSGGTTYTSYAYSRPFGMTIVPSAYATFANDGMIFGIMQTYSFKTQNLLCGASFYYSNDGTSIISEAMIRCGDNTIIDAIFNSYTSSYQISWGCGLGTNYMCNNWYVGDTTSYIASYYVSTTGYGCLYGRWYINSSLYFGSSTVGYLSNTSQNSTVYPYLYGTWYGSTLYMGTYSSYHTRLDGDQLTFYYSTTQVGELESYTTYTDVQGTWKTNGNSWISSSDKNLKEDINDIAEVYDSLFDKLVPVTYRWKAGTSGRTHVGFIAQDVKRATEDCGLTTKEFAAYVHFDATEKDGEVIPETCGIRYEEITPLNTWEIQKLKKRVSELERQLEEIRNETN